MQNQNNWNFDKNKMGNWYFYSNTEINKATFNEIVINISKELKKANLISYSIDDQKIIDELNKYDYTKRFCLLGFLNEFDEEFAFRLFMFNNGKLEEKFFKAQQLTKLLEEINHFEKGKDNIPNPISVDISGMSRTSICISINWDIFYEYVLCLPKWTVKYDNNDLTGPDEPVNYRKHAFNNVKLAKLNGTRLNNLLELLKVNNFIQSKLNFEHQKTNHWIGYHPMTNEKGIQINE